MDSVAPYDTTSAPQYRLRIIAGKQVYVPEPSRYLLLWFKLISLLVDHLVKFFVPCIDRNAAEPVNTEPTYDNRSNQGSPLSLPTSAKVRRLNSVSSTISNYLVTCTRSLLLLVVSACGIILDIVNSSD